MMAKGFIRLSMLMLIMHLETQCRAENRWISRPSQTISVNEGSNVTLAWRYILSNNITPRQITFGVWKPPGYIKTKLLVVTGSGSTMINHLVKGRLIFEGTLSNPGTATIKILHVSIQDNKTYGFEIDTGLSRSPFKHSFSLLVYTYPARPRNVIQELVTHSYLRLLWQQPIAHLYPITKYTVWIRKNQSRWRTSNTTLKESIVQLWGEGRYEFGVTAWNRWGQSPLEVNNTVTITRPSPATLIFTGRTEKKTDPRHTTYRTSTHLPTTTIANQDEKTGSNGFFEKFMTHILILIGTTILVTCGICLCVAVLRCRRKNTKGKMNHTKKRKTKRKKLANDMVIISNGMYREPGTFTLDKESNELAEELAPFTKFEVTCTLHNTDVPSMKTFGQRNNSVKSSNTNQVPTDNDFEGGVHIYQDIDQPQGPALPPRNSIKNRQESSKRNKSSLRKSSTGNQTNMRSSKKYRSEDSSGGKTSSTREMVQNEHRSETAKGGGGTTLDRKGSQNKSSLIYANKDCDSSGGVSSKGCKTTSFSTFCPSESNWEVSPESVHLYNRIGAGSFGQVWQGMIGGKPAAVKMLNERASASDKKDLLSELEVMKTLKPHPNVVKLKGCITKTTVTCSGSVFYPPLVFLELVPYGDLLGYLRKSRGEDDDYYSGRDLKSPKTPTPQHLFSFAHDVAKGMAFLAENKIVHRDLAARNVLIGDRLRCKITDFGMARSLHDEDIYTKKSNGLFPVKWMAVESLLFQKYTTYSDVWSYGVVLYEIFTLGGRPYAGMNGLQVVEMIKNGKRLSKPPHVYSKLYSLMLQCWSKNPNHRPDFSSLCKQITLLAKDHERYLNLKKYDHRLYVNVSYLEET